MLPRAADDLCHTKVGLDDCALSQKVPANIVRVCRVLLYILNLYLLGNTGLWVAYGCKFCTKCTNLAVATKSPADLAALNTDMGFSRC